jgi:hypothetical protein
MIAEPRRLALLEAGKLKLAAKARLAEGGEGAPYEAAVLYHAAARAEQRTLLVMEAPSPEARLANAIERCACLIEGFDAMVVLEVAWADVLVASSAVPEKTAAAMRSRIDAKMSEFVSRYQGVLAKTPAFKAWIEANGPWRASRSLDREIDRFLKVFPGDARVWSIRSWAYLQAGDITAAWEAVQRARELMPEETMFVAIELDLIPKHLSSARAEAQLDGIYTQIERGDADADICFGFVSAAMQLAQKGRHREKLLRQALDAAMAGFRAAPLQPNDRKMFRVMELSLREMLAGRQPTVEILYRCGLGSLATAAKQADPMAIVLSRTTSFPSPRRRGLTRRVTCVAGELG